MQAYKMLIDGAWGEASDGAVFETINPATRDVRDTAPEATAEDVGRAVVAAQRACTEGPWARMTAMQRGACLWRLAGLVAERPEDLGVIETRDTGKMLSETRWQAKYNAEFLIFYAGSRLIVHEDVADEFIGRKAEIARSIRIGDPMDEATQMGPLCTRGQIESIERHVAFAQEESATLVCGGKRADAGGPFYEPTILDCPRPDLAIVDNELFGPVLCVMRFRTEQEALTLANDTVHGLAAGIFTRDNARALRMARAVRAGIIWVNTYRVISPIAEFGGLKSSGYGRESGFQAVYDYTRPKTVRMNMSDAPVGNPFRPR